MGIVKHTSIPQAVKEAVGERDSFDGYPCCILCGKPSQSLTAYSNAHYIARSHGGKGIEQNILTLCPRCHRDYDGAKHNILKPILREYLKSIYPDWDEYDLVYHKGEEYEQD